MIKPALALVILASTPAIADHDHASHGHAAHAGHASHGTDHADASGPTPTLVVSVGAILARYHSRLFDGDYQGAVFGAGWNGRRIELGATLAAYQLVRNGETKQGLGDLTVHGNATLVERGPWIGGAHLMVMAPTGNDTAGLGMGHVMVMPAVWGAWSSSGGDASASVGYARGLGNANVHAEHGGGGAWPLVEPMSFSEVSCEGTAMLALASGLRVGSRVTVAIPTDAEPTRTIGGLRIGWRAGMVETTAELQTGLTGDPVRLRGVLTTALHFR